MKHPSSLLFGAFAAAATFAVSLPASALGPVTIEIAPQVGGGTNPIKDDPINILGFGLGGRAGVSFLGIYGGLSGAYYFGGSSLSPGSVVAGKTSVSSWLYGVQAGYGFNILVLTLRPTVEVGNYTIHATATGFATEEFSNIYIEPGLTALVGFGIWFVGADANVFLTPGLAGSQAAFVADGQVGVKF